MHDLDFIEYLNFKLYHREHFLFLPSQQFFISCYRYTRGSGPHCVELFI